MPILILSVGGQPINNTPWVPLHAEITLPTGLRAHNLRLKNVSLVHEASSSQDPRLGGAISIIFPWLTARNHVITSFVGTNPPGMLTLANLDSYHGPALTVPLNYLSDASNAAFVWKGDLPITDVVDIPSTFPVVYCTENVQRYEMISWIFEYD